MACPNARVHYYSVYGLTVASELELPELAPGTGEPEIVISVSHDVPIPREPRARPEFRGGDQDVRLDFPHAAAFLIHGGREITVQPRIQADPASVRMLVLGPAFGIVLHQRGVLALHASSVLVDSGVLAFLGRSGWGKSTMAAALQRHGHRLVADDITAVNPEPGEIGVLPAFPQLKLWPEAAAAMGLDPEALPRVSAEEEKRARFVSTSLPAGRLALTTVYVLAEGEPARVEPLSPTEALIELVRHSFCATRLIELGPRGHFLQCAEVARRVPVRRLVRPRDLARLDEVAALVERDGALAP